MEEFYEFLRENNFYEGWMEGYKLDNEIWNDEVLLEEFFGKIRKKIWLYSGPETMAHLGDRPGDDRPELQKRYDEWREKWLGTYMDLDEKWMEKVEEE